jgi:hypothetical protein
LEVAVPSADLPIHDQQLPQIVKIDALSVRDDVFFTNDKGQAKASVQKRSETALRKLMPALQSVLLPGETILYIARANSPLTPLEAVTAAWWTRLLTASAIVFTNQRLLFFPVKRDGSWRESIRAVYWGDLEEVKPQGLLVRNMVFKSKNGTKTTYTNFRRGDAKKIAAISKAFLPTASGEMTAAHGFVQLCPGCRNALTAGHYVCPGCGLVFKNEKTMIMRSILLPGGGYFYTGHPLIAMLPAIVEGFLMLEILILLFAGLSSPTARANILPTLTILLLFWALETAVTILHCRRYIRDFIPAKSGPARQGVTAQVGG